MQSSYLLCVDVDYFKVQLKLKDIFNLIQKKIIIDKISSVYKIKKKNFPQAPEYRLVYVIKGLTDLNPPQLLHQMLSLYEQTQQDIGIEYVLRVLAYDDKVQLIPQMTLPHPDLFEIPGYLLCATEVWNTFYHPVMQKTLGELLQEVQIEDIEFFSQGKKLYKNPSLETI